MPGDTPDVSVYDPLEQTVQGPPAGPLEPLLHVQAITAPLPAGELEYDGQLAHVLAEVAPEVEEYMPLGQLAHVLDEVAPEKKENVPLGQLVHVLAEVAPEVEEYVPAAQSAQDAEPASSHVHTQASVHTHKQA